MFTRDLYAELVPVSSRRQKRAAKKAFGKYNVVGAVYGGDGTLPTSGRQGKTGESVITQAHGKYYEAVSRGVVFNACDQGAGVAVGSSLTTTSILSLFNPVGSGYRLKLVHVTIGYLSGTFSYGAIFHCMNPAGATGVTAPTSGTSLTAYANAIGYPFRNVPTVPVGQCRTGSTVGAPIALAVAGSVGPIVATTASPLTICDQDMDGRIVVEAGYCYQLQPVMNGAGTSPKVTVSIEWEEIPWATMTSF